VAVDSLVGRLAGVSYLHIPAPNPAASAAFYRDVFGWQLHGSPAAPSASYPQGTLRVALFADPAGNVFGIWQETAASPDPP
jgi:predicted enzyme related to lactoylglutathione lyase